MRCGSHSAPAARGCSRRRCIEGLLLSLIAVVRGRCRCSRLASACRAHRFRHRCCDSFRAGRSSASTSQLFLVTALLGTRGDGGVLAAAGDAGDARAGVRYASAVRAQPDARPQPAVAAQRARDHPGRAGARAAVCVDAGASTAADRTVNGVLGFDKQQRAGRATQSARAQLQRCGDAAPVHHGRDGRRCARFRPCRTSAPPASFPSAFNNNSRRFFPEGVELTEHEARFAQYRSATSGYFRGVEDSAAARPLVRRLRSRRRRCRSRSSAPRWRGGIGATRTRSASDSSWRPTVRGSPWSACPATSCTTGSCGRTRPSIGRSARRRRTRWRFAVRTVGDPTALAGDLRRAVAAVDADQPIASLTTLEHDGRGAGRGLRLHRPRARRGRRDRAGAVDASAFTA